MSAMTVLVAAAVLVASQASRILLLIPIAGLFFVLGTWLRMYLEGRWKKKTKK